MSQATKAGFHRAVRFLGVRIAWNRYMSPVRGTAGAPVGIVESVWISTRRRAWGFGKLVDWAMLQGLEIKMQTFYHDGHAAAGGQMFPPIASEHGHFEVRPAITATQDDNISLSLTNRNAVVAGGFISLAGITEVQGIRGFTLMETTEFPFHLPARGADRINVPARVILPAALMKQAPQGVLSPFKFQIQHVRYRLLADSESRWTRIHGRPEWEA